MKISKKTINKISETKLEASRQKIISGIIKNDLPEQSDIQLAIPSHRTRKFISFTEFKNFLQQGKSLQDLNKLYSKHLMAFYSYLSQGKVTITKDQFVEEYKKGMSLDEISKLHNIPREHITYLREYYGIKRKGAKYIKRLQNEVPLSQEAKDIIIGSILGDGHITPLGYFSEKHSEKQVEYLEWKAECLKSISTKKSFKIDISYDKRYNSINYSFCFRTITHDFLYKMRDIFYQQINGKYIKIIPHNMETLINEKVLAIWFMDDGYTDWGYRNEYKKYPNSLPQCEISSESFSLNDNMRLKTILKSKYDLDTNIHFKDDKNKLKPYIRLSGKSSVQLIKMIKKFSTRDLLYKFDEQEYLKWKSTNVKKEEIAEKFRYLHNISK